MSSIGQSAGKAKQSKAAAKKAPVVADSPVCSPAGLDNFEVHGSCFSLEALKELAEAWNTTYSGARGTRIDTSITDPAALRKQLAAVMEPECGKGRDAEMCWVQKLGGMSQNREAARMLMPPKPKDWNKNPHKWLNNYDISHALERLEGDAKYPYKLLGVFPIDFQGKDSSGAVLYPEMHNFELSKYMGKYKFLGLITNLDTHDGPGTHWTSTFICIDPTLPCFGAYYYDSTFTKSSELKRVPPDIVKFFRLLKRQAAALPNSPKFKNVFYRLNHQKGNTECGMFSIYYQVHWINSLIKNNKTIHKDIVRLKITDDQVFRLRDFFFVPSDR
jgi:hypothetical protein